VGFNPIRMRPVFVEMKTIAITNPKAPAARKAKVQAYADNNGLPPGTEIQAVPDPITLVIRDPAWVRRLCREAAEIGISPEEWVECMMRATTVICENSPRGISVRMSIIELHHKLRESGGCYKWKPPGQPSPRLRG
jgi:hypothetical protein